MNYESLLIEAEKKGIVVKEKFMHANLKGAYKDNKILINLKVATNVEKKCILSEEMGHHETSSGNILDTNDIVNRKQEVRARKWGYRRTVKIDDLIRAYEYGAVSCFEIAEYLSVTQHDLIKAIDMYKNQYGIFTELKNHFIYFEPYIRIEKKDMFFEHMTNEA